MPLPGLGFGLREPVIVGQARVALNGDVDLESLDLAMALFVEEPLPEEFAGTSDAVRLVDRALHWAGAFQRQLQIPVFGRSYIGPLTSGGAVGDTMTLAVPCFEPEASAAALTWVAGAIRSFLTVERRPKGIGETARREFERASKTIQKHRPEGVNTFRFLKVAHEQNIPVRRFMPDVYCFGIGARSRWLQSTITDRTPALACRFAANKFLAASLLRGAGLPAAVHALAKSAGEAIKLANRIGYPVVVKPADQKQGKGVSTYLTTDAGVASAYEKAITLSKLILVEKHVERTDYRMTVVNGRVVRITEHRPFGVVGDGKHTIAQLVEIAKATPRYQQEARERGKSLIDIDEEAMKLLDAQTLGTGSVPAQDQYVRLRRLGNISTGSTSHRVDDKDIHPDNHSLAERAAAALRLDVAGVDAIFPDISRSWLETGAHICEVNAQPQFGPSASRELLPELLGGDGRIPVMIVIGRGQGVDWTQLRNRPSNGMRLGFASIDGVWLGEDQLTGRLRTAFEGGIYFAITA